MKKKLLIILGVLYALVIAAVIACVIYFWSYISAVDWKLINPSNIKALYQGLTESPEVTAERKKQLDSERSDKIKEYINLELREYTEEERRQIESGEKSETQILAQIIAEATAKSEETPTEEATEKTEKPVQNEEKPQENKPEDDKPQESKPAVEEKPQVNKPAVEEKPQDNKPQKEEKPQGETAEQIVARHVSELYVIQSDFEGRVIALASSVKNWTAAYRNAHPGMTWRDAKIAAVEYFSGTASAIEKECYAKVDGQMEKLKNELKAIGADTSIASTIKSTAYAEMDAKKTQIVQEAYTKLNKKG